MDGYAVRSADTAGATRQSPVTLRCVGQTFTGQVSARAVGAGECIEVATGAPIPPGADAVVIVEDTADAASSAVRVFAPCSHSRTSAGRARTSAGARSFFAPEPSSTRLAQARFPRSGQTTVEVYAKPRVAILSTGDEIVEPGVPLAPGQIYDINKVTLSAVVSDHGGIPVLSPHGRGHHRGSLNAVDSCLAEDVLVFSGGSSVGGAT